MPQPNSNAPSGLSPVNYLGGVAMSGQTNRYLIDAAEASGDIFIGDVVRLAGSSDPTGKYPTVTKAASGTTVIGVITAVELNTTQIGGSPQDSPIYRQALTERYVLVADEPNQIFEVQEDSDAGALANTDIGLNADFIANAGSTATGLSGTELDSSSALATNTLDMQILRLVDRPDNHLGTNAKILVRLNNHQFVDGVTGV